MIKAEILERLRVEMSLSNVDLVALSYSLGDGLTRIVRLEDAPNRGLESAKTPCLQFALAWRLWQP